MNRYAFIPVIAVVALAGCTSEPGYLLSRPSLDADDRALLTQTHDAAQQAKNAATKAAQDAKAAHDAAAKAQADADKAVADAQAASDKVNNMLQNQSK